MRQPGQHILYLATEYAAGMRPYALAIIKALWQQGDHVIVVIKDKSLCADFKDFKDTDITVISYPESKLGKLSFRVYPQALLKAIGHVVKKHNIGLIYSLTGELVLCNSISSLQRKIPFLYTVHDAAHHDVKFTNATDWVKDRLLIATPQRLMVKRSHHVITNSHVQEEWLKHNGKSHQNVFYAPFPTLVNEDIMSGGKQVEELQGIENYVLFFGNVHFYKGVHVLYDAWMQHTTPTDRRLVIAGSHPVYFKRQTGDEQRVTFINRFLDDCELRDLFSKAALVVYPYISATQSGVISIASFFGKPIVLSDLPFFKNECGNCDAVTFFKAGDSEALAHAIAHALQAPRASTVDIYKRTYDPVVLQSALNQAIGTIFELKQ